MTRVTDTIFSTVHGSRLYGLETETSDYDMFTVTTSTTRKARQRVSLSGVDSVTVGLDTFIRRCNEGSHQSVEALFSPLKIWGMNESARMWRHYLEGMRITSPDAYAKYERTIKSFCFGNFKLRRHAGRLALNLADLRVEGKFNPMLSPASKRYIGLAAERYTGEELWNYLT